MASICGYGAALDLWEYHEHHIGSFCSNDMWNFERTDHCDYDPIFQNNCGSKIQRALRHYCHCGEKVGPRMGAAVHGN